MSSSSSGPLPIVSSTVPPKDFSAFYAADWTSILSSTRSSIFVVRNIWWNRAKHAGSSRIRLFTSSFKTVSFLFFPMNYAVTFRWNRIFLRRI